MSEAHPSYNGFSAVGKVGSVPSLVATNMGDMISRPASLNASRMLAFRLEWVRGIATAYFDVFGRGLQFMFRSTGLSHN